MELDRFISEVGYENIKQILVNGEPLGSTRYTVLYEDGLDALPPHKLCPDAIRCSNPSQAPAHTAACKTFTDARPPRDNPRGGLCASFVLTPSGMAAREPLPRFLLFLRLMRVAGQHKRPVACGHRQIVPRKYAMIVKGEVGTVARTVAAPP